MVNFPLVCADHVRTTNESVKRFRACIPQKDLGRPSLLRIVESRRDGAQVRQQVIAALGRIEDLRDSGRLERLLRSGARFAAKAIVVDAVAEGAVTASAARRIGPALVFERLSEETGCRQVIEDLAGSRKHGFPLERAVSHRSASPVCWRLRSGGGPLARGLRHRWRRGYRPASPLSAMAWLGEELSEDRTGQRHALCAALPEGRHRRGAVRAPAQSVQQARPRVHGHDQPLFRGAGGQTLGQRGFSKDHRPDLDQMILAVLLDGDGRPVCTEMWPGNTADVGSLVPSSIGCASAFPFNASASSPIAA